MPVSGFVAIVFIDVKMVVDVRAYISNGKLGISKYPLTTWRNYDTYSVDCWFVLMEYSLFFIAKRNMNIF